jgi:putative GTP pyrophosphokinase
MATFPQPDIAVVDACIEAYRKQRHHINIFAAGVRDFFATHPSLAAGSFPTIHSTKFRLKDEDHLREKIIRKKVEENRDITPENLFKEVTDLAGVRVLHLHKEQFVAIHTSIQGQIDGGHWFPFEKAKAYTWDPDSREFYQGLGLDTFVKDSHYTSVHYVMKPNDTLPITCEIQVRTLFEEVWGEMDHAINYPAPSASLACKEELRVLAKLVGAGTRLCEAIFRSSDHGKRG